VTFKPAVSVAMAGNEAAMCMDAGVFAVDTGMMFPNILAIRVNCDTGFQQRSWPTMNTGSMFMVFVPMFMNISSMFMVFVLMFMNISSVFIAFVSMFMNMIPMFMVFVPMFMNFGLMFIVYVPMFMNIAPVFTDITPVSDHGVGDSGDRITQHIFPDAHLPSPATESLHAMPGKQDAGSPSHGVRPQESPDEVSSSEAGHLAFHP